MHTTRNRREHRKTFISRILAEYFGSDCEVFDLDAHNCLLFRFEMSLPARFANLAYFDPTVEESKSSKVVQVTTESYPTRIFGANPEAASSAKEGYLQLDMKGGMPK